MYIYHNTGFSYFYRIKKFVYTLSIQTIYKLNHIYNVYTLSLQRHYIVYTMSTHILPSDLLPTLFIQFAKKIIIKLCIYTNPKIFGLLTICLQIVHTVFINGVYDITMITNKAHAENVIDVSWISLKINQSQIAQNKSIKFVQFAQTLKNLK